MGTKCSRTEAPAVRSETEKFIESMDGLRWLVHLDEDDMDAMLKDMAEALRARTIAQRRSPIRCGIGRPPPRSRQTPTRAAGWPSPSPQCRGSPFSCRPSERRCPSAETGWPRPRRRAGGTSGSPTTRQPAGALVQA